MAETNNWIDRHLKWIKIVVMIAAYGYLVYMLATFDNYKGFADNFDHMTWQRWALLLSAVMLTLVNWGLEGVKWWMLVKPFEDITLTKAVKSVLIGLTVGFFTPNRVGEPAGRVLLLSEGKRLTGISLVIVGALGQVLANILFSVLALIMLSGSQMQRIGNVPDYWIPVSIVLLVATLALFLTMPKWSSRLIGKTSEKGLGV